MAYAPSASPLPDASRQTSQAAPAAPSTTREARRRRNGANERSATARIARATTRAATRPTACRRVASADAERREEEELAAERRIAKAGGERPDRDDRDGVVERLAHEERAVGEAGDEDGQRRREEREPGAGEGAGPEEDGDRGRGHDERLRDLRDRQSGGGRGAELGEPDEQRVEEAVVRHRLADDGEAVAVHERASDEPVEVLVRRDPRRVDATREDDAHDGRDEDEGAEREQGTVWAEAARHRRTLPVAAEAADAVVYSPRDL